MMDSTTSNGSTTSSATSGATRRSCTSLGRCAERFARAIKPSGTEAKSLPSCCRSLVRMTRFWSPRVSNTPYASILVSLVEGHTAIVQFSAGSRVQMRATTSEPMTLIARADAALYRAKNNGRNRVELAE